MTWETIATFDTAAVAVLAKNMLESHGIRAELSNEETVAMAWSLSNAVGGIALKVLEHNADEAKALLERAAQSRLDGESSDAIAENPATAARIAATEFADPVEDVTPTDIEVDRVLKATVFGMILLPLQLYTLCRLIQLRWADPPVRASDRWKIRLAYFLTLPLWFAVLIPGILLLGVLDGAERANWRNERFGGFGDAALTIDFPGQYGYRLSDEQTRFGPTKVREFGVTLGEGHYWVTIKTFPKELTPADPIQAARDFVEDQFDPARFQIESIKRAFVDNSHGLETVVTFVDGVTRKPRVYKQQSVMFGNHLLLIAANLPADHRDSATSRRFFQSIRIR